MYKRISSLQDFINESVESKWEESSKNTKLFPTEGACGPYGDKYLQGCKHCNEIVKLDDMYNERQMLGNCYQSLCKCSKCKRYVIFDEQKASSLELYLNKKK
jgi:hypothetical protein